MTPQSFTAAAPDQGKGDRDETIAELRAALEAIHDACDAEIKVRFRTSSHKSEEQIGRNSAIYSLLVVPRNIARTALAKARGAP